MMSRFTGAPEPSKRPSPSAKHTLRALARRWVKLNHKITEHDELLGRLSLARYRENDATGQPQISRLPTPLMAGYR